MNEGLLNTSYDGSEEKNIMVPVIQGGRRLLVLSICRVQSFYERSRDFNVACMGWRVEKSCPTPQSLGGRTIRRYIFKSKAVLKAEMERGMVSFPESTYM